eukprot:5535884-Prymnesium_polylepis.1
MAATIRKATVGEMRVRTTHAMLWSAESLHLLNETCESSNRMLLYSPSDIPEGDDLHIRYVHAFDDQGFTFLWIYARDIERRSAFTTYAADELVIKPSDARKYMDYDWSTFDLSNPFEQCNLSERVRAMVKTVVRIRPWSRSRVTRRCAESSTPTSATACEPTPRPATGTFAWWPRSFSWSSSTSTTRRRACSTYQRSARWPNPFGTSRASATSPSLYSASQGMRRPLGPRPRPLSVPSRAPPASASTISRRTSFNILRVNSSTSCDRPPGSSPKDYI